MFLALEEFSPEEPMRDEVDTAVLFLLEASRSIKPLVWLNKPPIPPDESNSYVVELNRPIFVPDGFLL